MTKLNLPNEINQKNRQTEYRFNDSFSLFGNVNLGFTE